MQKGIQHQERVPSIPWISLQRVHSLISRSLLDSWKHLRSISWALHILKSLEIDPENIVNGKEIKWCLCHCDHNNVPPCLVFIKRIGFTYGLLVSSKVTQFYFVKVYSVLEEHLQPNWRLKYQGHPEFILSPYFTMELGLLVQVRWKYNHNLLMSTDAAGLSYECKCGHCSLNKNPSSLNKFMSKFLPMIKYNMRRVILRSTFMRRVLLLDKFTSGCVLVLNLADHMKA